MTSSEFALLTALRNRPHGEIASSIVIELHQSTGLNPTELSMILQSMCADGLVSRSAGVIELARVKIAGKGILALEQYKHEADQLATERAEREISRENQKKANVLNLIFKILSAIAGFFAFLI